MIVKIRLRTENPTITINNIHLYKDGKTMDITWDISDRLFNGGRLILTGKNVRIRISDQLAAGKVEDFENSKITFYSMTVDSKTSDDHKIIEIEFEESLLYGAKRVFVKPYTGQRITHSINIRDE